MINIKIIEILKKEIHSNSLNLYIFFRKFIVSSLNLGTDPDFLIIGAQKSGTTSLFNYIKEFGKNFIPPVRKEIRFFSEEFGKGINYYRSYFPLKKSKNQITGEATPAYLFYHKCPKRIYKTYPNIKLIAILRNPLERAYSHYNFIKYTDRTPGTEPLSFKEALLQEENRINFNNLDRYDYEYKRHAYKAKGLYYYQLKRWFKYFPKEQVLIIESHNFFNNTRKVLDDIFNFIGIRYKKSVNFQFEIHNKNEYPPIDTEIKNYLVSYFKPHNHKLYKLIGKKYDWDDYQK